MDPRPDAGADAGADSAALRVPPHSVPAEQSVLGALLNDNRAWDRVADLLLEADFYRHEHKLIYGAVGRLINSGRPADVVTVFEALGEKQADVGGLSYLNAVAQSVPSMGNARRYAEIVRERSLERGLLTRIYDAQEIANGDGGLAEKLEAVAALFANTDVMSTRRKPQHMGDVMIKVIDQINAAAEGGEPPGWKTGISKIDWRMNGGLKAGKLVVLAARPSVGKTSFAGQVLKRTASDGHASLMLSQEMEADEVGERSLANQARVDYGSIQLGKLDEDEWSRIAEGVDVLGGLPLWIDDEPALNMRAINSKARGIPQLRVMVVDYVQLCEGEGDNRTQQIGSISRGLKKLAKQLGICIIALSQLNREVDKRPGRRPQMSDLRDSGEIEQDADTIIFLWPLDESEDDLEVRHVGCDFAKNRRGKKGSFVMTFQGAKQLWAESHLAVDSFGKGAARGAAYGGGMR